MSVVKDYWSKINVNLIIDPKETAVYNSIVQGRTHKNGVFRSIQITYPFILSQVRLAETSMFNASFVVCERCEATHETIWDNYMDWNKQCQALKEITPYLIENAWTIMMPAEYLYTFWQPWVKNYHGEFSVGNTNNARWCKWIWYDQELREEMLGK